MKRTSLRALHDSLTPLEREVMAKVVLGLLNKQRAAELGMTEKTVKFHRGHIMRRCARNQWLTLSEWLTSSKRFLPRGSNSAEAKLPHDVE